MWITNKTIIIKPHNIFKAAILGYDKKSKSLIYDYYGLLSILDRHGYTTEKSKNIIKIINKKIKLKK